MRVHKSLGVPELSRPAPFALKSSYQDEQFVVFTSGESYQLRFGSLFIIGISIFGFLISTIPSPQSAGLSPIQILNISVNPIWVLVLLSTFLFIAGLKYYFEARKRSQIVICLRSGAAQIQYQNGKPVYSDHVHIHVTKAKLLGGPLTGRRTRSNTFKQGEFFVVAFAVVHDCFIIGAFRNIKTAIVFAQAAADETGLVVNEDEFSGLKHVAGERMYFNQTTDKSALNKLKNSKPMQPISFVNR